MLYCVQFIYDFIIYFIFIIYFYFINDFILLQCYIEFNLFTWYFIGALPDNGDSRDELNDGIFGE